jgi:hypothetical protein
MPFRFIGFQRQSFISHRHIQIIRIWINRITYFQVPSLRQHGIGTITGCNNSNFVQVTHGPGYTRMPHLLRLLAISELEVHWLWLSSPWPWLWLRLPRPRPPARRPLMPLRPRPLPGWSESESVASESESEARAIMTESSPGSSSTACLNHWTFKF